jgi:predicted MFS family arabinose efflux permease
VESVTNRFRGLWRDPEFLKLWTGQTISRFGSTVTREAIPLTALLLLNATPLQLGALAAAGSVPVLVVSFVAGVWIDRVRRRPVMIAADLARAVLLLAIPFLAFLGQLQLVHLFIVGPLVGILNVFFDVAYQSFVPSLVSRENIVEANSKLSVSESLAEVTAPGVGGVLIQVLTAPVTLLIDAVSFVASAGFLLAIRRPEAPPKPEARSAHPFRDVRHGLRSIVDSPVLSALAAEAITAHFFGNFFASLYAVFGIRVLGMTPALLGLAVAAGGAGGLIGSLLAERVTARFGIGRAIIGTLVIGAVVGWLTPLASGPVFVATMFLVTSQFLGDGVGSVFQIATLSVRQAVTPDGLLGRVNGGMYLISAGIGPLGALFGGYLGGTLGVRETLALAVLGGSLGGLWILFSPIRSLTMMSTNDGSV